MLIWDETLSFVYNGEEQAPKASVNPMYLYNNDDPFEIYVQGARNVGTYTALVTGLENENYTIVGVDEEMLKAEFTITPRVVEFDWSNLDLTYNGEMQYPTATLKDTVLIAGDECIVTVTGAKDAEKDIVSTVVSISNDNYTLEGADAENLTAKFTIKPKEIELEWNDLTFEYDGASHIPTATVKADGLFGGDEVLVTVTGDGIAVGTYTAGATALSNGNYALPEVAEHEFSITARKVVLSWGEFTFEYNGLEQTPQFEFTNRVGEDDVTVVLTVSCPSAGEGDGEIPESREGVQSVNVGKYVANLTLSGTSANNYELDTTDLTKEYEITPKSVTLTLKSKDTTVRYTGEAVTLSDWYEFIGEEFSGQDADKSLEELFDLSAISVTPQLRKDGNVVEAKEVGRYQIFPTYTGEIGGNPNYIVTISVADVADVEKHGTLYIIGAVLELNADSSYQFIFERKEDGSFRETYAKYGYVHGLDDRSWDRIVLGEVKPGTTLEEFLANLADPNRVKLYDHKGQLIYSLGIYQEGYDALKSAKYYAVGTGWRVEYITDNETDTVYISVLGDINGDGFINAIDTSILNMTIRMESQFEFEEVRLAAYVFNSGTITASDVAAILAVIKGDAQISDYYFKTELPEEPEIPVEPEIPAEPEVDQGNGKSL